MSAVLFEPAAAIAAGLCITARTISDGRTARHQRPCGWCDFPTDELRSMVDGFNEWADYDERTHRWHRYDAQVFNELSRDRQRALVLEAQGFSDETAPPEPMEPVAPPPADAAPSWMPS